MIYYTSDKEDISTGSIGGKAFNLFRLKKIGLPVPNWVVIPQTVLQDIIPEELKQNPIREDILELVRKIEIQQSFLDEILSNFQNSSDKFYAVRSSAIDEDSAEFSFAGQFETYLYVNSNDLAESIRKIWLSAFSERVMTYRDKNGLKQQFGIAVIVQEMINAEVAGVGFGINPTSGDRETKVISSVYGLGEGLVSGELNADTYILKDGKIDSQLTDKSHAFVQSEGGGIEKIEIEDSKRKESSLSNEQLQKIAVILDELLEATGKPQDIEFAVAKDVIYILQTRPITSLDKVVDKEGEYILWDNSNIIESYPGVTTPLTFSFIIKVYEAVYIQLAGILGVSDEMIEENANTFANTLGLLYGRVYYNLLSWYKMLAMVPGYSLNAEYMETMMGVKERFELKETKQLSKTTAYYRLTINIFKMLKSLVLLPRERRRFTTDLNQTIAKYKAIDYSKQRTDELMYLYMEFEQTLLKKWRAPLVNDFFSMIYFGVLQKLISKYKISDHKNLHNDLLCGSNDIISTEPIHASLRISTMIIEVDEAHQLFKDKDEKYIWNTLLEGSHPEIKKAIDDYIDKFGERCVGELKLETVSYTQEPSLFVKIIKSYVVQGITTGSTKSTIEQDLRSKAEREVKNKLKFNPIKKLLFNYVLAKTRELVSGRENLRYERTRAFGIVREIFTHIGKKLYAEGVIEHPRDIFYLKLEETISYIQGTSVNASLIRLIALRKEEFDAFEKMDTPSERIPTYGVVYHANDFYSSTKVETIEGDLEGIGCCPGQVKARVRVVKHPNEIDSMNGDILVTSSTDPGWVTLFPTASAIIVERGSLLSHSAIVSREMGIPCIVGVTGLLKTLKTGDMVTMDGSTGVIKILEENGQETA